MQYLLESCYDGSIITIFPFNGILGTVCLLVQCKTALRVTLVRVLV